MRLFLFQNIRKNKREIPKEFLPNKQRVETPSVFEFQK